MALKMCRRRNAIIGCLVCTLFFVLLFNLYEYSAFQSNIFPRYTNSVQHERREFMRTIPLVIVDQHHEVIPYWLREIVRGNIPRSGNTLLHIDAHSDFDLPLDAKAIKNIRIEKGSQVRTRDMLPMMERNDRFILSAVAAGIFNQTVWIHPMFSNVFADEEELTSIGVTNNNTVCGCFERNTKKNRRNKKGTKNPVTNLRAKQIKCYDNTNKTDGFQSVDLSECTQRMAITSKRENEGDLNNLPWRSSLRGNIILDIDLDFFGVASDFVQLLAHLSPSDMDGINTYLNRLFCPRTAVQETAVDTLLQAWIGTIADSHRTNAEAKRQLIIAWSKNLWKMTPMEVRCNLHQREAYEEIFALTWELYPMLRSQLHALKRARFCLAESPIFPHSSFGICHGVPPWDQITHFHQPTSESVAARAKRIAPALRSILAIRSGVRAITVARSIRDAYSSRPMSGEIENVLIGMLKEVAAEEGIAIDVEYDENLLFGRKGFHGGS